MFFKSVADLNADIISNLWRIPRDITVVAAVPRSGMLPATLIALYLNLPLVDFAGLLSGRVFEHGKRSVRVTPSNDEIKSTRALIVDDSVLTGQQIETVKATLCKHDALRNSLLCAPYVVPTASKKVDIYFDTVPHPRVFEWNVMHHSVITESCIDIDGILCEDPTDHENDDGEHYERFLNNASPRLLPSMEIGWLISCRLQRFREQTVGWLRRNQVRYRTLILMDVPSKAARLAGQPHGVWKGRVYRTVPAKLFIESCARQAPDIARIAKKPVLCLPTGTMFTGVVNSALTQAAQRSCRTWESSTTRIRSCRCS